jgi:multidrug efflux pump subunit AcrB
MNRIGSPKKNKMGPAGRIAFYFMNSKLTPLAILASLLFGFIAVIALPREEEPQIIVPMIDVFVQMPGASAKEVEERVTRPMEKLLWEIPGVEYIYSTSSPGFSMAVVRFYVGQDEEKSLVRLNQKLQSNVDLIPPGASMPLVKPRSIDDVPILAITLSSSRYDSAELRKVAASATTEIKQTNDVSEVKIIGGRRRILSVDLDPQKLESYQISALQTLQTIGGANYQTRSGEFASGNKQYFVETSGFIASPEDLGSLVVGAFQDRPVYLRNVASIADTAEEPHDYVFYWDRSEQSNQPNAVTITVAKRKNKNAVTIGEAVLERMQAWQKQVLPSDIKMTVTRNYGETAKEKSNELLLHMMIAVFSVTLLIAFALGRREAMIVGIAIPVTLALTLAVVYLYGYTLNRITLFALIFSIGILVDDAIVLVENIVRHRNLPQNAGRSFSEVAAEAVDEVGNPTILATLVVIAAILPMAFVGGLSGPYMRPIPVSASAAMVFSLIVAFVVTPWAAVRVLKKGTARHESTEGKLTRWYRSSMNSLIKHPAKRNLFIVTILVLLLASIGLVAFKVVTVKMLPFDNKSEVQVIIDMPEGTTLEETARATQHIASHLQTVPEVVNYETYIGTAAPYNFNGLVRHYFLRQAPNVADIQVNFVPKGERSRQSHQIASSLREPLNRIAALYGANIKIAEVPPGPPVLETLVAEVYGPDYKKQTEIAKNVASIFQNTDGVVDVDSYIEERSAGYRLVIDQQKASMMGVNARDIAETMQLALTPRTVGLYHRSNEPEDVDVIAQIPRADRSSLENVLRLKVRSAGGQLVSLSELGHVEKTKREQSIYHKNLMPVVYVTADVAGREEGPVYAILKLKQKIAAEMQQEKISFEQYSTHQPPSTAEYSMKWDGEWHITYEMFRDLGLAFAIVLVLIYILVASWFQSFTEPLVIMAVIPFSLIGIFPGHALMGAFFTATSMIGFIAGAGIVARNSIILVDFIHLRLDQGMPLEKAIVDAGAVRFRPMVLTAAAVITGSAVIIFDPIFQGMAVSLMAGEVASLLLSRAAVPIFTYLLKRRQKASSSEIPKIVEEDDQDLIQELKAG